MHRRRRTALFLYAVLLVLPTLILGGLQWHQIHKERRDVLARVPAEAEDVAQRLQEAIRARFEALIAEEEQRPFFHYAELFAAPEVVGDELVVHTSPLHSIQPPAGVLGWFSFNRGQDSNEVPIWWSAPARGRTLEPERVAFFVETFAQGAFIQWLGRFHQPQSVLVELAVAAVHRGYDDYRECLEECYPELRVDSVDIALSEFHVQLYRDGDGVPQLVATRRALLQGLGYRQHRERHCLDPLRRGFGLVQGFFIDTDWLFDEVPHAQAANVLGDGARFLGLEEASSAPAADEERSEIRLVEALELEVDDESARDLGVLGVAISTRPIEQSYRRQLTSFLLLALMLTLSLGTGMWLLLRSVSKELEQAAERENFVASVTHELRTPISGIQLHGEMLLEGWTQDPDVQREYYRRIVNETGRLSTLVERILQKSRLARGIAQPAEPGDLSEMVRRILPKLDAAAGGESRDLDVQLAEGLPLVMLEREGLEHILVNLVENARKYAPWEPDREGVRADRRSGRGPSGTAASSWRSLDRGPGVPAEERRGGSSRPSTGSATRPRGPSHGTGLGLHLVKAPRRGPRGAGEGARASRGAGPRSRCGSSGLRADSGGGGGAGVCSGPESSAPPSDSSRRPRRKADPAPRRCSGARRPGFGADAGTPGPGTPLPSSLRRGILPPPPRVKETPSRTAARSSPGPSRPIEDPEIGPPIPPVSCTSSSSARASPASATAYELL